MQLRPAWEVCIQCIQQYPMAQTHVTSARFLNPLLSRFNFTRSSSHSHHCSASDMATDPKASENENEDDIFGHYEEVGASDGDDPEPDNYPAVQTLSGKNLATPTSNLLMPTPNALPRFGTSGKEFLWTAQNKRPLTPQQVRFVPPTQSPAVRRQQQQQQQQHIVQLQQQRNVQPQYHMRQPRPSRHPSYEQLHTPNLGYEEPVIGISPYTPRRNGSQLLQFQAQPSPFFVDSPSDYSKKECIQAAFRSTA